MRHPISSSRTYPGSRVLAGLALGIAFALFCQATAPPGGSTFMDSPLYPWGWVALPLAAAVLTRVTGEWGAAWGVVLVAPQVALLAGGGQLAFLQQGMHFGTRAVYVVGIHALVTGAAGAVALMAARPSR